DGLPDRRDRGPATDRRLRLRAYPPHESSDPGRQTVADERTVAVVGAGLMGSGIAQVAAVAGYDVVLHDVTTEALERGTTAVRSSFDRFVAKERMMADDADAALARITTT